MTVVDEIVFTLAHCWFVLAPQKQYKLVLFLNHDNIRLLVLRQMAILLEEYAVRLKSY